MATKLPREWTGSTLEARTPNFEINPNFPNSKFFSLFGVFEPLGFEFVSDFGIRISNLSIRLTCLVPAMPG
jgi:hypothetical protein